MLGNAGEASIFLDNTFNAASGNAAIVAGSIDSLGVSRVI